MKWGVEQDAALAAVAEWMNDPERQLFRLFGYAGTGKTTLARHFAEGIDGTVLFGAYTGKAAHVLRQKGCHGATTLHAMIYHSKDKGRAQLKDMELQLATLLEELKAEHSGALDAPGLALKINNHPNVKQLRKLIEEERNSLARPMFTLNPDSRVKEAELVVIDECSMVDGRMGEDLLSFGKKVLVLGDPAQLPPVGGAGFFTENVKPDIMLQDIHRQAADNPIIRMATQIRNQQALSLGRYGESSVISKDQLNPELPREADQILVGRNATRHASNRRMRALLGLEDGMPVPGDKLVCLRNNQEKGLLNGALWYVEHTGFVSEDRVYMELRADTDQDGANLLEVEAHSHYFKGEGDKLAWYEKKEAEEFDYGYALTVHKSQGSQWDDVLLFDESWAFRADRWRWLYTGITRAAERVTVVNM